MRSDGLPPEARYERGAARVFGPDGAVAGAGFLVGERLVCTCAHVVQEVDGSRPDRPVTVDFPLLAGAEAGPPVTAEVVSWRPEDDVALLRLALPVDGTEPLPFVDDGSDEWGGEIRSFGFPEDVPRGVNATGVLRGRQRADRLQLDLAAHGVPIAQGFSGAAVWDVRRQAVVGMLVTRGRYGLSGTAYLIPVDRLLDTETHVECPFRGLGRFEEQDAPYFHGRAPEVRTLVEAVGSRPLTVLAGPSGSGKSSLLRAGLLAELRRRGTPSALRVPQPATEPAGAALGDADAWAGEAVVAAWHAAAPDTTARRERLDAVLEASAGPESARIALRGRLRDELGPSGAVLLLDQFEEHAAEDPRAALRVFRTLSALTAAPDPAQGGGLRVVLTARPATLESLTAADTSASLSRAVTFLAPMTPEALALTVDEPVRSVPGLRLQDGLSARLVRDAAGEPGCLPLLQFTLTELWRRKKAHTLTHSAYEEIGGVGGALASYADEALTACLARSDVPEAAAQRLFQRLARPDGQGGFTRRSVATGQLPADQAGLALGLAGRRLLVWDVVETAGPGDPGGAVQVVHEALLHKWPRLAEWLRDDAGFCEWQERTARDAAEWEARGRPAGLLSHGVRLAQGLEWLAGRPDDLTSTERAYLEAGRRRQRRGLRRLWGVTGLVTALAVLASGLAVNSYRAHQRDLAELRTAASTELSELAGETAEGSPDSAFRYAAGAWTMRHTPQAQRALFQQYVRARDTTASYSGLWRGAARTTRATPDGRTLVVVSQPNGRADSEATVVTGALDAGPRALRLRDFPTGLVVGGYDDALSDDGRRYALATTDGRVLLWNLTDRVPRPRTLSGVLALRGDVHKSSVDFSDDGRRLLHFYAFQKPAPEDAGRHARVRLWDPRTGRPVPASQRSVARDRPSRAWLLGTGDRIAVAVTRKMHDGENGAHYYLGIHTVRSGERVRQVYGPMVSGYPEARASRGHGVWLTADGVHRWYTLVPRPHQPSGTLDGAVGKPDLTGTHLYAEQATLASPGGDHRRVTFLDARGGRRYWAATLPGKASAQDIAVVGEDDEPRTVLTTVGDSLIRVRPVPVSPPARSVSSPWGTAFALAPDGSRAARVQQGRLEVLGPGARLRGTRLPALKRELNHPLRMLWATRDGKDTLLLWAGNMKYALLYDVDTLASPARVTWNCGRPGGPDWNTPEDVVRTADGEIVLLCLNSALVRLDPRTGLQSGGPVPVEPASPSGNEAWGGQLTARPGHPDQVAVVTQEWGQNGRIEVWDVRRGTRLSRLKGAPLAYASDDFDRLTVFTPDGDRLAARGEDRRVEWWQVDEERGTGRTGRLEEVSSLLGVAEDGTLVADLYGDIALFSPRSGKLLGRVGLPSSPLSAWQLKGDTLRLTSDDYDTLTLRLSPAHWHDTLCSAAPGPYSPAQRTAQRLRLARDTSPCPSD
ncbi:trypsin-like peptidase domain-containing protein [Streptomyces sp. NBC_00140]|uniref:nSTAND1 domain-containing NTPase n=1 Tax=Streptomyces sp. NBC_00140 TaxID=2975664 RepID=UPI00225C0AAC|nr:trypsin-like peptidase domain-containing protein [Streptomyces sp. NBC_00140]MCX5330692.1 trypsin-like peptidase domain-containing protein [Streptomyces sp. NBC_00140]